MDNQTLTKDYVHIYDHFDFLRSTTPQYVYMGTEPILDIRQFLNLKPSIKRISLSITQWSYLLSIRQHITRAMYQASNAE
jgi:hypothetical protein